MQISHQIVELTYSQNNDVRLTFGGTGEKMKVILKSTVKNLSLKNCQISKLK